MSDKNSRLFLVASIILVLVSVQPGFASVPGSCETKIDYRLVEYIDSLVGSLTIPLSCDEMNSYEQMKLDDVSRRKIEIMDCLDSLLLEISLDNNIQGKDCYVQERGLPLLGAIGAMLESGSSVKHLWPSNLKWLRFKSSCQTGQSLAARIRAMRREKS